MSQPRLAYLLKKFPRLSETFVLNEILAQEALGVPVHVFSRRAADDEPRHPELGRLRAEIETLPDKRELDPWETLFFGTWNAEESFARVGRVVEAGREWKHPRFPTLLAEALFLYGRMRELGIDHVHAHFATDSAVVAMLVHELGGPSFSLTVHAKDIYRSTVSPALLSRLFAAADFVVTVCDANVRHLHGLVNARARTRIRRLYNGIDLGAFAVTHARREPAHIVSVGRLVEKKGFDVLVDALQRLDQRAIPFRATVVGDGDEREALAKRIDAAGIGDRVRLAGALDQDAVRDVLATGTVLCLPCVIGADGNRDALPTVLLEALASGLPVVSTPVTGIPEIVDRGRAGVLVPEHDADATANALERLLADPAERARLARAGRARAEELFHIESNSRVLHGWFNESLSKGESSCALPA